MPLSVMGRTGVREAWSEPVRPAGHLYGQNEQMVPGKGGPTAAEVVKALKALGNAETAAALQRFFKTAKGEYAEGDVFIGIKVPVQRRVAKEYGALPLEETEKLLRSKIHEARLVALIILVEQFRKGDSSIRDDIFNTYLANTKYINNWDLVDTSAPHIVGAYLGPGKHALLTKLARSSSLWERRIAILATQHFIRLGYFAETLRVAELLLKDSHDLIHKAVGWMLREVGNRDRAVEEGFLDQYASAMPRTMLRYAIEKFPSALRTAYMRG